MILVTIITCPGRCVCVYSVCVCGFVFTSVSRSVYVCMYTWGQPISEDLHVSKLYIQTVDISEGVRGP